MKNLLVMGIIILITSCATSMSPSRISSLLPALTKAKFYSSVQASEAIKSSKCKVLVHDRKYLAPIGLTTRGDLKNGAKGIDEWVSLDGGNAYTLKNYQWLTVDEKGSTQLQIEFNTMTCD